ncbi:hypothetical protein Tco_0749843 [Tanacetum coccineum]|uniref:Uncharacterized protein n=1 Tax=Tanacetum coccineum TaxID=301880 RepID=A0ABQ4Z2B3_9ASTR
MFDSEGDTKILNVGKKGEDVSNTVALEERIVKLDEGQAGSDPGKTLESRPSLDEDHAGSNPRPSHVALAGPNPEPMHEDFIATIYPKNLDDAFTYGDQFMFDKPTEEEPCKANMETVVESMVIVPIHQASSIAPPLSTLIIDLTQPKPTAQAISSRIFTLENHNLYSKIDKYINENVKDAIQDALKDPVCERFGELSEFEMKEILRDRMFESGSYRSQPEHTTLYEALEASMDRENREEFMDATAKSRNRRRNDQDPPLPPPKDSDQSKKKRHDSDASASQQPQAQTSSAWKSSDTREAPSSSSQHKTAPQSEQPVDDVPIPDDVHISDSEDTGTAHLLKIKTRPDWLKPVPEEERPETPEPDWVIPLNDLPEPSHDMVTHS